MKTRWSVGGVDRTKGDELVLENVSVVTLASPRLDYPGGRIAQGMCKTWAKFNLVYQTCVAKRREMEFS